MGVTMQRTNCHSIMSPIPTSKSTSIPRLFADFNGYNRGDDSDSVELDTWGTLCDLHNFRVRLATGLIVTVWENDGDEDLEVTGDCAFDHQTKRWNVYFAPTSFARVPKRDDPNPDRLEMPLCFECRVPLPRSAFYPENGKCPTCGLSITYPFDPPPDSQD